MTWAYCYRAVTSKGQLGWVGRLPAVLVRFLTFCCSYLSLSRLTALGAGFGLISDLLLLVYSEIGKELA